MRSSSGDRFRVLALAMAVLIAHVPPAARADPPEVRFGGVLGFGVTARRDPGAFRWDFDSAHEDTTLAVLRVGAGVENLRGFVSLGARLEEDAESTRPRFELREASLVAAWRRATRDSLALRIFARQPQSLWVEYALVPAIAPGAAGASPLGGRADAVWGPATGTLVVAQRGTVFEPEPDGALPAWDPPAGDLLLVRLRGDALRWGGLRAGATWKRWRSDAAFVGGSPQDAGFHDVLGIDVRGGLRGVLATVQLSGSHPGAAPAQAGIPESAGPVTRTLPETSALRAELRCRSLRLGRWGALGFAPQYRALGRDYVDRLAEPEPDAGSPRRGLEGYLLDAWYELPGWPGWLRQTYDRHQQFRDADRRIIQQLSEVEILLTDAVRGGLRYVQRDERLPAAGVHEHHDDLVAQLCAADRRARFRLEGGVVDLDALEERDVLVLEAASGLGAHVQLLSRVSVVSGSEGTRRGFFAELQYWHLPQFELAVQYGPEWLGDGAWPAQDGDLVAGGSDLDRVRLHFRGWF